MTNHRFRYFFALSVIIGALAIGWGFTEIQSQQTGQKTLIMNVEKEAKKQGDLSVAVAEIIKSNLDNRAKNIGTWCGAINANRIESKRTIPGWKLKPLDCKGLERATVKSGGPVPIPTGVSK